MSNSNRTTIGTITLDDLVALNDEIAALTRAGVPLERGLRELATDLPGRMGRTAKALADRAAAGESLSEIIADESVALPPAYRAVVEAGVRAGRLPAALETMAGSIRRLAETRRGVVAASLYPLLLLIFAWAMLALFAANVAPQLEQLYEVFDVSGQRVFGWLSWLGHSAGIWGPAMPVVLILLAAVWWYRSAQARSLEPRWTGGLLGWLPWMGKALRWSRAATFVELLALLVENRVPLGDAIVLAAEASGDRHLAPAAREMAESLQHGRAEEPAEADGEYCAGARRRNVLPPLLTWLLAGGGCHGALVPALRSAAETYHRRAQYQADVARIFLPVLMTGVIGGGVVLVYCLMLFGPYTHLLQTLGAA